MPASAALLPNGRLHLQHGPIDLIVDATGPGRQAALTRAARRFAPILDELVADLAILRMAAGEGSTPQGTTARAMRSAVLPFAALGVTPMAAVAGAVADEILGAMTAPDVETAYVNNGGDVALWIAAGQNLSAAAGPLDRIRIDFASPIRGIATSGWRGRSHSLGIADSVTALAPTAAMADAAATMIANAVDLPGNPKIRRVPARELAGDSDLGDRRVTVDVAPLTSEEAATALATGDAFARDCLARGLIHGAFLRLSGRSCVVGPPGLVTA